MILPHSSIRSKGHFHEKAKSSSILDHPLPPWPLQHSAHPIACVFSPVASCCRSYGTLSVELDCVLLACIYRRRRLYLETVFKEGVKRGSLELYLIQYDWCYKKSLGARLTEGRGYKDSHLQQGGLRKKQPSDLLVSYFQLPEL